MSNPDLSGFTPNAGNLNRDEVLFAMGQASAKTSRCWKWSALALALVQAGTVAAWLCWPEPTPREIRVEVPTPMPTVPPSDVEPPMPRTYSPDSYISLTHRWQRDDIPLSAPMSTPSPNSPPLHVRDVDNAELWR